MHDWTSIASTLVDLLPLATALVNLGTTMLRRPQPRRSVGEHRCPACRRRLGR